MSASVINTAIQELQVAISRLEQAKKTIEKDTRKDQYKYARAKIVVAIARIKEVEAFESQSL